MSEYDIEYQAPSAKKAQVLADFLVDYPERVEEGANGPQEEVICVMIAQEIAIPE